MPRGGTKPNKCCWGCLRATCTSWTVLKALLRVSSHVTTRQFCHQWTHHQEKSPCQQTPRKDKLDLVIKVYQLFDRLHCQSTRKFVSLSVYKFQCWHAVGDLIQYVLLSLTRNHSFLEFIYMYHHHFLALGTKIYGFFHVVVDCRHASGWPDQCGRDRVASSVCKEM